MDTLDDKTVGIVLSTVPLNDHAQLVHFYTQSHGRITCRVPLVSRGRKAASMRNMMTPMTMLELILSRRSSSPIRTISEAHILQSPYILALSYPDKWTQCLFMAELIIHTVREEEANPRLWDYLTTSLQILEGCDDGYANFHLIFTCGLINLLGFSIDTEAYTPGACFDMIEGCFTTQLISHPYYLNAASASWFCRLLDTQYSTMHLLSLRHNERVALLDMLLTFLAQQMPEMGKLRSIEVLKDLFS